MAQVDIDIANALGEAPPEEEVQAPVAAPVQPNPMAYPTMDELEAMPQQDTEYPEIPDTINNNPQMEVDFWENSKRVLGTASAGIINSAVQLPMDIFELADYIPGVDLDPEAVKRAQIKDFKFTEKPEGTVPNLLAFGTQFLVPFLGVSKMMKAKKAVEGGEAITYFQKLVQGSEKLGTKAGGVAGAWGAKVGGKVGKNTVAALPASGVTDFVFMTPDDPNFANLIAGSPEATEGYLAFLATNADDPAAINRLRRVFTDSFVGSATVELAMRGALGALKVTGMGVSKAAAPLSDVKIRGKSIKDARDRFELIVQAGWDRTNIGKILDDKATEYGLHEPGEYGLAHIISQLNQVAEAEARILNETFAYPGNPILGGTPERVGSSVYEIERKLKQVEAPPHADGTPAGEYQSRADMWELVKYTQAKAVKQHNQRVGNAAIDKAAAAVAAGKKVGYETKMRAELKNVSGGIPKKEIDAFFRKHNARPESYKQSLDGELQSFEVMNQDLLKFAKQTGLISEKDIAKFNDVSFLHASMVRRAAHEVEGQATKTVGTSSKSTGTLTKAREGLTEADLKSGKISEVGNVRENTMLGMQSIVREAYDNIALQKLATTVEKLDPKIRQEYLQPLSIGKGKDAGYLVDTKTRARVTSKSFTGAPSGLMQWKVNGKVKYALAKDPLVINFIESFGVQTVDPFIKAIGVFGAPFRRVLTASTTLSPTFSMGKNFLRDTFFIATLSRVGFVPIVDSLKGLALNIKGKGIRLRVKHKAIDLNKLVLTEREALLKTMTKTEKKAIADQTVKSQWQRDFNQKLQDRLDMKAGEDGFPIIDIHDIDNSAIAILKKERKVNGELKYDMVDVAADYRRAGGAFSRRIYDPIAESEVITNAAKNRKVLTPEEQSADIIRSMKQNGIPEDQVAIHALTPGSTVGKLTEWAENYTSQFETAGRVQHYAKATKAKEKARIIRAKDELSRATNTKKKAKLEAEIVKLDEEIAKATPDEVAGIEARNVAVDLANRGTNATVTTLVSTIPFFNAILQGVTRSAASLGGKKLLGRNLNKFEAAEVKRTYERLAMASMGLVAIQAYHDVSEELTGDPNIAKIWRGIPEYIKSTNAVFVLPRGWLTTDDEHPYRVITIPLPLDFNIPLAAAPQIVNYAFNPEERKVIQMWALGSIFAGVGVANNASVPQFIRPWVEVLQNEKFTGSPIIPEYLKDADARDKYKQNTGSLYIAFGRMMGLPPLQVEHIMNTYMGTMLQAAMRGVDAVFDTAVSQIDGAEPGGTLDIIQSKTQRAERYPDVISSSFDKIASVVTKTTSGPGATYSGSDLQQKAYERLNAVEAFRSTVTNYRKGLSDPSKFNQAIYDSKLNDPDYAFMVDMYPIANGLMKQVAKINSDIRALNHGRGDPSERYKQIDRKMREREVIFLQFDDIYSSEYRLNENRKDK